MAKIKTPKPPKDFHPATANFANAVIGAQIAKLRLAAKKAAKQEDYAGAQTFFGAAELLEHGDHNYDLDPLEINS